jgi:uncharacterized protein (DUF2141 family)
MIVCAAPVAALIAMLLQQLPEQPRDARPIAHGTGVISGVVVSDDLETRSIGRARVTLTASNGPAQATIADERGRFVFADLPAGSYTVSANKRAWITTSYGAKRPGRPGFAISVGDGQKLQIVLRMPRGAVLSGIVHGYAGEPASRVTVQAMRYAVVDGGRRLVPAGNSTVTDDRGAYRLYGLPAGDYAVQAVGRETAQELYLTTDLDLRYAASQASTPPPRPHTATFAATYFPSATNPTQAMMVTLRAGEERDDIDVQIQLEPTVRIEGAVAPLDTGVPPGTEVILVSTAQPGALPGGPAVTNDRRRVGNDGSFVFPNLAPGTYTLVARAAAPQLMWSWVQVAVYEDPVTGIVLSLQPGMHLSGRVQFAPTARTSTPDMSGVRVALQPVLEPGAVGIAPVPVTPAADGSFTVNGVTPGRYRLSASFGTGAGRVGGWVVRSAIIGGQDTLDVPITIQPNQNITEAAITFVDRAASLTGKVLDASGHAVPGFTVVLFPADQSLWLPQARRIKAVPSSADGAFTISGLPPGEYVVSALEDAEPGEWFDPAFLQRLLPTGVKLVINEGETKTQDVRAGGG